MLIIRTTQLIRSGIKHPMIDADNPFSQALDINRLVNTLTSRFSEKLGPSPLEYGVHPSPRLGSHSLGRSEASIVNGRVTAH